MCACDWLQVLVTRNWWSHGSGHVTVAGCTRALQSLIDMLGMMVPVVLSRPADADAALASIQSCITRVESAFSDDPASAPAELSIEFHSCLIFMRALVQLRAAACSSAMLKTLPHDSDISEIIIAIRSAGKLKPEQVVMCDVVDKGRHYMLHGTDTRRTLALLQCTCAVAPLLRFLGAPAAEADACEASAMQLMQRMGISDVKTILQEVVASHSAM